MKIEHIALYVNDLENAKQFFIKYFGAEANDGYHNLRTDFRSYFLTFDDGLTAGLSMMQSCGLTAERSLERREPDSSGSTWQRLGRRWRSVWRGSGGSCRQ